MYIYLCRLRATERRGDGAVEGGQGALRTPLQALHQEAGTTACRSLYVGVESYSGQGNILVMTQEIPYQPEWHEA